MSDITPIGGPGAASLTGTRSLTRTSSTTGQPSRSSDSAEFSQAAQLLSKLADIGVRQDRIDATKAQIEAGTYLTDDKIDAAIDELLDDLQ